MTLIPTDTSGEALIRAIRLNMSDFFRHISRSVPEEHFENGRFTHWRLPIPHPWFSGVLCSSAPGDGDDDFVPAAIRYFRAQGMRTFTWWMEPPVQASDWEPVLSRHGFGFSNDTPGMAVELQSLDDSKSNVKGLEIRRVSDPETLRTWSAVFTRGYDLPADWAGMIFESWIKLGLDFPVRNYLGYLNGEPVSTSSLFLGGGAAGIYDVATIPGARGRGIGAALTLHPLLEARESGYQIGVLQSSDMGYRVYQRLGFRHLCPIEYFHFTIQ